VTGKGFNGPLPSTSIFILEFCPTGLTFLKARHDSGFNAIFINTSSNKKYIFL